MIILQHTDLGIAVLITQGGMATDKLALIASFYLTYQAHHHF
jgi:hypothetical protein